MCDLDQVIYSRPEFLVYKTREIAWKLEIKGTSDFASGEAKIQLGEGTCPGSQNKLVEK